MTQIYFFKLKRLTFNKVREKEIIFDWVKFKLLGRSKKLRIHSQTLIIEYTHAWCHKLRSEVVMQCSKKKGLSFPLLCTIYKKNMMYIFLSRYHLTNLFYKSRVPANVVQTLMWYMHMYYFIKMHLLLPCKRYQHHLLICWYVQKHVWHSLRVALATFNNWVYGYHFWKHKCYIAKIFCQCNWPEFAKTR